MAERHATCIYSESPRHEQHSRTIGGSVMLPVLINVVTIVVIGVICFSLIDWFVRGKQLGNLLKILVALICVAAIVQRVLPALGVTF
jgi:hypothetical protein